MKKIVSFALVVIFLLTLCACNNTKDSQYVGTWVCSSWVDDWGKTHKNGKLVLKADGTGTYKPSEEWAIIPATWEQLDENTIIVYADSAGITRGEEHRFELINGKAHLIFDNGIVERDFVKQ